MSVIATDRLLAQMEPVLPERAGETVGVAVSGGSDSLALLLLMERWAQRAGCEVRAVTLDHGLRHGSAAEAQAVADLCRMRGLAHACLHWQDWDGRGNLQAAARMARRRLIARWAKAEGIGSVALGHTLDDQAETFLLRLARGSGVDGLGGMQARSALAGICWLRPLLGVRRDDLRAWLSAQGMCWAEDPSNEDLRFDRVRVRSALDDLATIGLTPERLAETASRMQVARAALEAATGALAARCASLGPAGEVALDPQLYAEAPEEIRTRLLSALLCWVGGEEYRPRYRQLSRIDSAICAGDLRQGLTLHGCVLRQRGERILIRREPERPDGPVDAGVRVWDGRWRLVRTPGDCAGLSIAALGREGLRQVDDWRAAGVARETLLASPAVWRRDALVAAPLAGHANGFAFRLCRLPAELAGMSQLD